MKQSMSRRLLNVIMVEILCVTMLAGYEKAAGNQEQNNQSHESENQTENDDKETVSAISDYKISVNGEIYSFPMKYEEFKAYGWKPQYIDEEKEDVADWEIQGGSTGCFFSGGAGCFRNDNVAGVWPAFRNESGDYKSVTKCDIVGLIFDNRDDNRMFPDNTIAIENEGGKIWLGTSTRDDVLNVFGEPYLSNNTTFIYEDSELVIGFNEEDIVSEIKYILQK